MRTYGAAVRIWVARNVLVVEVSLAGYCRTSRLDQFVRRRVSFRGVINTRGLGYLVERPDGLRSRLAWDVWDRRNDGLHCLI